MLITYLMEFITKGITLYTVQSLSPGNKMLYLSPSIFNVKIYSLNLIVLFHLLNIDCLKITCRKSLN